jgi:hypothetical protein
MIRPSWLLKAGVSNTAISLPYIQSRSALSELMPGCSLADAFSKTPTNSSIFSAGRFPPVETIWREGNGRVSPTWLRRLLLLHAFRSNHVRIFVLAWATVNGLISQSETPAAVPASASSCSAMRSTGNQRSGVCCRSARQKAMPSIRDGSCSIIASAGRSVTNDNDAASMFPNERARMLSARNASESAADTRGSVIESRTTGEPSFCSAGISAESLLTFMLPLAGPN